MWFEPKGELNEDEEKEEEEEVAEICILLTCDGDGGRNVLDLPVLNACVKVYMYEP